MTRLCRQQNSWKRQRQLKLELRQTSLLCCNFPCNHLVSVQTWLKRESNNKWNETQAGANSRSCLPTSQCKAWTANQQVPTSSVAKRRSVDRPIKTESTESITDWANKTGAIGFLPILNTEAWWENSDISSYSQTASLTNCGYNDIFFLIKHKKLLMFTPKLPTAALS